MKAKKTVTAKVVAANKKNAERSTGPKTERGKNNSRFNALTHGLFSQQLVIQGIGEKQADFDALRAQVWADFQPVNIAEAMLAAKLVHNSWRWLRIRRSEDAEVQRTVLEVSLVEDVRRAAQVYTLRNRFYQLFAARIAAVAGAAAGMTEVEREKHNDLLRIALQLMRMVDRNPSAGLDAYPGLEAAAFCVERNCQAWEQRNRNPAGEDSVRAIAAIEASLEEVRSHLASTSEGLLFLKETASLVLKEAEAKGTLSDAFVILLRACRGIEDQAYQCCVLTNSVLRKGKTPSVPVGENDGRTAAPEGPKDGADREPGKREDTTHDAYRKLVRASVNAIIFQLDVEGKRLACIEAEEKRLRIAAAGLLPPDALSRLSRAEAPVDRQFNQALVLLLTLKNFEVDPRFSAKSRR